MQRLILLLFSSAALPMFAAYSLFKPRLRKTLAERLGFSAWLDFKRPAGKLLWVHAASLGEVNGVIPVVKKIKAQIPEIKIIGTTTSDTGKEALSKYIEQTLILPFDHPWLVASALELVKPDIVAISETEIWPSFILEIQKRKIPLVYFNARISDYTFGNYKKFSLFLKPMLKAVNALYAQTQVDVQRFSELGVRNSRLAGNTKSDLNSLELSASEKENLKTSLGIANDDLCLVAGSVHPGEDRQIIDVYLMLKQDFKNLKLVLAPRHNFNSAAEVLDGLNFGRRSEKVIADICLLDTVGELARVYSAATVAFVGGSLVDIGGHNPMEPAAHSVPVVMGMHTATVRDSVEALRQKEALFLVKNKEDLYDVLFDLFSNPEKALKAGKAAREVLEQSRGATDKVVEGIKPFLLAQRG